MKPELVRPSKQETKSPKMTDHFQAVLTCITLIILIRSVLADFPDLSTDLLKDQRTSSDWRFLWDQGSLYSSERSFDQLHRRTKRSNVPPSSSSQVVDACQSKVEVITPYYATNAKGNLRKIVNSELMQQAVQVETCSR